MDQLAKDVEDYATGSPTLSTRQGFGQLLGAQTDPRAFMTRSATSGHRSRSSISQLQLGLAPDRAPTSASATAINSLTAALSPSAQSFTTTPTASVPHHSKASPSRASDALAGMLGSVSSAPAPTPTPPPSSPSAAVAALMRRTSSYATISQSSPPPSPSAQPVGSSSTPQRRVTSPHLSNGQSHARPSLAHSRSAVTFQAVAEEEAGELTELAKNTDDSIPVNTGELHTPVGPVTTRSSSPTVRRPMVGHARKAPSISSLSMLTGSAMSAPGLANSGKSYGALTRSEGYRSLSTPSPVANTASASPYRPTLAPVTITVPTAAPISINPTAPSNVDLASSVNSAHQRPSSLQQRHSSAGEDLMRVHAEGSSAGKGHRRKDSNLKDAIEGLRGAGAGEAKGKEKGGGWWGWR